MLIFIKIFGMKLRSLRVHAIFYCIFFYSTVFAQSDLEAAKNKFVLDSDLTHAAISICVLDLDSDTNVVQHNDQLALPPASTVKLFATASAFEFLGPNYRPKTRLYATSEISKAGVISSDLWIRGGGDISLGSRFYNEENEVDTFLIKWADSLYQLGLRKIEGNIIGDASEFGYQGAPDGWNWSDMGNYYGSGPSGLPIYDNMLRFYFHTNSKTGTPAQLDSVFPKLHNLSYVNQIESSRAHGDNSYIYGAPYSYERIGTGYLPRNKTVFMVKGSLPDPELTFAQELKRIFELRGIQIVGQAQANRKMEQSPAHLRYKNMQLIYSHSGESLNSIAQWTNLRSVNVFAEQLICLIAQENGQVGSTSNAVHLLESYWSKRIQDGGLDLRDGSGLSRSNAVSAANFCSLLQYMHTSKYANEFRATLAVAGESGTLKNICRGEKAQGRIWAKSGSMNKIKAYSGYVKTVNGKNLAFAIIVNNHSCSTSQLINKIEVFMNAMATY